MLKNYFKIAFRNLVKNKVYSFINIGGLAMGMAVAMLIGLWVYDELSYDKFHKNYKSIGQLYQNATVEGKINTFPVVPIPLANDLRNNYPDFKAIALVEKGEHLIIFKDKKISKQGMFVEPDFSKIFSLEMLQGSKNGLENENKILLSKSLTDAIFGQQDPIGKVISLDNKTNLIVGGVFENFPHNSEFAPIEILAPWQTYSSINDGFKNSKTNWSNSGWVCYVNLNEKSTLADVQLKLKGLMLSKIKPEERVFKQQLFIHPMKNWHLFANFSNGVAEGGIIQMVWLFGIIGFFVILLACINFMNLSTARSQKRAKEVGIRKAIGSEKSQLILQFLSESFLIVFIASLISILLVLVAISWFNDLAEKQIKMPYTNGYSWLILFAFIFVTGILAGGYPALYLSSFKPVKVLKGAINNSWQGILARKALVVLQFTVSVSLIIGTIIIYQQIKFAKNRPLGYDKNGLIYIQKNTPELNNINYDVLRNELLATNVIEDISQSSNPITDFGSLFGGFSWEGIAPNPNLIFNVVYSSHEQGNTLKYQFLEGRDFSRKFSTDSSAIIVNEAASKIIGRQNIIGKTIFEDGKPKYHVIGVVKDMVVNSPFENALPSLYLLNPYVLNYINIKIKPSESTSNALSKIETAFKKINPSAPFDYKFADLELAKKYSNEERIGNLATFFAILAIFISCLGLFGLATFVAEQRTKEIGIRKVLGASVANLWQLLSKDFVILVIISCLIAAPIAYYFMDSWLQKYTYRTEISWWIFIASGFGALLITLLTVSYQAIKAALMNPVKSLKTE